MTSAALDQLANDFTAGDLPAVAWTHAAHLAVGAWHVHHFGPDEALLRLRRGIRALNDRHGTANTPTSGYHETITAAYTQLIAECLATFDGAVPLHERVATLLAGPLSDRTCLLRFWSRDRLMSPEARATWVPPDLAPLAWPPRDGRTPPDDLR